MNAGDRGLAMTHRRHVAQGRAPGGSPGDRQRREALGARNVRARPGAGGWRPDANIFSLMVRPLWHLLLWKVGFQSSPCENLNLTSASVTSLWIHCSWLNR